MAPAERSGDPLRGRTIIKITDLFWLAARLGDRFGAWDLGGFLSLIKIFIFSYSNVDFDPTVAQVKFPQGNFPGEISQGKFPRENFPGEISQGKFPRGNFPGEISQGKFPRGDFPGEALSPNEG